MTLAAGIGALMMRLAGLDSLGDLAAVAYLASATVAFGRPLSRKHLLSTNS